MGCVSSKAKGEGIFDLKDSEDAPKLDNGDLPRDFDAGKYAEIIHDAFDADDEDVALKAIQDCSPDQGEQVEDMFQTKYNKSLLETCEKQLSPKLAFTAELLLRNRTAMVGKQLRKALENCENGTTRKESTVIEIICSCSTEDLNEIKELYQEMYGLNLGKEVTCRCSEEVADILSTMLKSSREIDTTSAEDCATKLVEATNAGQLFTGDKVFLSTLKTKPTSELQQVFEHFLKKCQRDITVEIEKFYTESSKTKDGFIIMAKLIRNPPLYVADKVKSLMTTESDEEMMELLFTLLIQDVESMKEVKQAYKSAHLESMSGDIKEAVKDPIIQRVLLKAIK